MAELGRLMTAMVTPLDSEGKVDWDQTKRLANALIDSGSDGIVVGATTGEGPTLSHEEKLRLWGEAKAAIGERGAVVASTGNYSTSESIELSKQAEEVGVDGLLLVVPYYNKPPQEGIYQHFKAIASSTHLPCILYNIPGNTTVLGHCQPIYEEMPGWEEPTAGATKMAQLPKEAAAYIKRLEELLGCPFHLISTGPHREETIQLQPMM